jgi:uncharacterized protein (TIGR02466 family)
MPNIDSSSAVASDYGDARPDASQIRVQKMFSTPVALVAVPEFERLNVALRRHILTLSECDRSATHSNMGGWQSRDDLTNWQLPETIYLMRFVTQLVNQMTAVATTDGLRESDLPWRINAWANVNHAGASNALHGHPGAYWSGVYWVDDGGRDVDETIGGELELQDPRGLLPAVYAPDLRFRVEGCLSAGYSELIAPRAGTICLFPAWLLHKVNAYRGGSPRISIAFNFSV